MLTLRIGPDRIVFDFIIMSRIGLSGLLKPQDRMTCRFRSVRRTQCWRGGGRRIVQQTPEVGSSSQIVRFSVRSALTSNLTPCRGGNKTKHHSLQQT